tara:strand:+ start:370 stop:825 length:456 start_codon:yes stop_codon:yes gene_type:complete
MAIDWASGQNSGTQSFPSQVIQVVYATTTTEESNSNSSYITWFSKSWTPLSSSSHKLITVYAIRNYLGNSTEFNYRISDGSNVTPRYRLVNISGNYFNVNPVMSWYWTQTHTAGNSVTFSAQCRDGSNGSSSMIWGDNNSTSLMTIMEIQP